MQDQAVGFGGGPSAHDFTRHLLQDDPMKAAADALARVSTDLNIIYLVIMGALVFFMQAGFGMLEVGIVQPKNSTNILFKNTIDASMAAIAFWLIGYGFAFGDDYEGFIGKTNFGCNLIHNGDDNAGKTGGSDGWQSWFFQWAFTGAAATIVAGSICERAKIEAYFFYSFVLSGFIYPVVVHWCWGKGLLSAWGAFPDANGVARPIFSKTSNSNGLIDFAGSGVVHMVGGFSGLMGALVLGPRKGRFVDGQVIEMAPGNKILQSLGVFCLWFGWYGFNCGSTLLVVGYANLAAKVAFTMTISASSATLTAALISKILYGYFDISLVLNGTLAGLVGITANCAVVDPWMAFIIGLVSAFILYLGHYLLLWLKIDDPCDATVVHGFCGYWGLLCSGIFCTDKNVQYAAYPNTNDACARGEQFGVQVVGGLLIIAWCIGLSGSLFIVLKYTVGLRVTDEVEDEGLDASEHGEMHNGVRNEPLKTEVPLPPPASQPYLNTTAVFTPQPPLQYSPQQVPVMPFQTQPMVFSPMSASWSDIQQGMPQHSSMGIPLHLAPMY